MYEAGGGLVVAGCWTVASCWLPCRNSTLLIVPSLSLARAVNGIGVPCWSTAPGTGLVNVTVGCALTVTVTGAEGGG